MSTNARVETNEKYVDEYMSVLGRHHMIRSQSNRSVWLYVDAHIPQWVAPARLVTDDFGTLVPDTGFLI